MNLSPTQRLLLDEMTGHGVNDIMPSSLFSQGHADALRRLARRGLVTQGTSGRHSCWYLDRHQHAAALALLGKEES